MKALPQATPVAMLPSLPPALTDRGIALRPQRADDQDFLRRLYVSTRWDELAPSGWLDAQKLAFLSQQFQLQDLHYTRHYAQAARGIVTVAGQAAGRLYLLQQPGDLRIVDISLLPEHRSGGIGTALIGAVFDLARATSGKVSIHVETFNPARRLYDRLGFTPVGVTQGGIYHLMEWQPH